MSFPAMAAIENLHSFSCSFDILCGKSLCNKHTVHVSSFYYGPMLWKVKMATTETIKGCIHKSCWLQRSCNVATHNPAKVNLVHKAHLVYFVAGVKGKLLICDRPVKSGTALDQYCFGHVKD